MDVDRLHAALAGNLTLQPAEITVLQQEIAALDKVIAAATFKRKTYGALLPPLRRGSIPPEVLGEIFSHALAGPDAGLKVQNQLRSLCPVCSAWRKVALSSPRLSRHIQHFLLDAHIPSYFNRAKVWLKRGGSLPKRLELDEVDHGAEEDLWEDQADSDGSLVKTARCPLSDPSLADLLAQVPILSELSITCHGMECFEGLLNNIERIQTANCRPWDLLRSLELQIEDDCWVEADSPRLAFLTNAPAGVKMLNGPSSALPLLGFAPGENNIAPNRDLASGSRNHLFAVGIAEPGTPRGSSGSNTIANSYSSSAYSQSDVWT